MKIFNFIKNINNQIKVSNEANSNFKQTANNLANYSQNTSSQTSISSQFELLSLSAQERVNLIKELLSLPKDIKELNTLLKQLTSNNLINIKELKELIAQNAKESLNKLIALNTINHQGSATQSKEIQEIMNLLAAFSIPSKSTPELLKEVINIYVPISNPKEFEVQIEENNEQNQQNDKDSYISFLIESKETGLFFIEIFKDSNEIICIIKTAKDNENTVNNIKNKLGDKVQINFIEITEKTQEKFEDKLTFFQNNIADLDILNFIFNLIQQIYLLSNRKENV